MVDQIIKGRLVIVFVAIAPTFRIRNQKQAFRIEQHNTVEFNYVTQIYMLQPNVLYHGVFLVVSHLKITGRTGKIFCGTMKNKDGTIGISIDGHSRIVLIAISLYKHDY